MIKKLIPILLAAILLAGCGNKTTIVSNQSDALIKVGTESITVGEVYNAMLAQDATAMVKQMATQIILNKEVPITDEMKAEAQTELDDFKASVGDMLETYLDYYGFKDEEDYYTNGILPTMQQEILVTKYLNDNYATIGAENLPKKVRIIEVTDATLAETALSEIKGGKDFGDVAIAYSTSSFPGNEELVYAGSELPDVVLTWMNLQTVPTLSTVIPDTTNATNYIVQITVADANKLQTEAVEFFAADTNFMDTALKSYFVSNGFKIYDKTIYDAFVISYSDYLAD